METKTFRGTVDVFSYGNYWDVDGEGELRTFPVDEWDMEVAFTKKVKPIEAGHWVWEDGVNVWVLAVAGCWAWITSYPNDLDDESLLPDRVVHVRTLEAQ